MKLNPIYTKELKISVRNNRLYIAMVIYNGMLALFTLLTFLIVLRSDIGGNVVEYNVILKVYGIIVSIEFCLLIFIMPVVSASTISVEVENQTLELLLATSLHPMYIILGKLMYSVSCVILLAVSSIPILSLVFIIGGISFIEIIEFLLLIVVTGIYIGSIGIFCSSIYKKTVLSTITSYGSLLILVFGTLLSVWVVSMIGNFGVNNIGIEHLSEMDVYYRRDTGNLVLILLINPLFTCLSMIVEQVGNGNLLYDLLYYLGEPSKHIVDQWFAISLCIQMILSFIFIILACLMLRKYENKSMFHKILRDKEQKYVS